MEKELTPIQKMQLGKARKAAESKGEQFDEVKFIAENFGGESSQQNPGQSENLPVKPASDAEVQAKIDAENAKRGEGSQSQDSVQNQGQEGQNTGTEGNGTVSKISERLSQNETSSVKKEEDKDGPKMQPAVPFDFANLTIEQRQQLKKMLSETPDRGTDDRNPTITLRKIDGKHVIEVGKARSVMVFDAVERREIEKFKIPVKFLEGGDFVEMDYQEFMKSERVTCEVIGQRTVPQRKVEGKVWNEERKTEVEQVVKFTNTYFKIHLPTGQEIEIPSDSANM